MKIGSFRPSRGVFACALLATLAPTAVRAQSHRDHATLPNLDRRHAAALPLAASNAAGGVAARQEAATALRGRVKNLRIEFDALLGTPAFVGSVQSLLTGPGGRGGAISDAALDRFSDGDPHRVVKAFLDEHAALFGHDAEILGTARVGRDYVTTHNGLRSIKWDQQLDDIRVFEATLQAHLTRGGELVNIASRLLPDPERAASRGAPDRATRLATPVIVGGLAVAIAARDIGEELDEADVIAEAPATGPEKRQRFAVPVLLDAEAQYVWLPLNADTLRLCWEIICTGKSSSRMYRLLVDAESGEVLVRQSLTEEIGNVSYRVFTSDSPTPFSPGHANPSSVQPPLVPRALVTLAALSTTASPNGWIDDGVLETRGNNVDAHTDIDGNNLADLPRPTATLVSGERVFDPALDLTQSPATYRDAAVVNLFYWCNWMHDKLYDLGFTEPAGNFQVSNFGRGGAQNDPVQADAQDGSEFNNATFSTPPDGSPGRMQMFLWVGPTPARDGDFDQEVVLHEYTHGLTNRLVGGGVGLSALQSRGMGEGWSDFYPLTLLAQPGDDASGNWPAGGYISYLRSGVFTENYYFGGRRYPYSTNLAKNPLTFRDIDPAQANAHAGIPRSPFGSTRADELHNMGEVWCVTLWEVRANLIAKHGFAAGTQLTLQLVTDALKLSPANPNFVQARDAILQADLIDTGGANRLELWAAFAKRGLGINASSPASTTTVGLVESFTLPDDLAVAPSGTVAVAGNVGGPFAPQTYTLSNTGAAPLAWTAANTQAWATLSSVSGTLAAGATVNVVASFTAAAGTLPQGTYADTLTFTNTTSGVSQSRALVLTVQPPPTIASFSPTTLAPGLAVTIAGSAFISPVTVSFNGVPATSVTINSPTQITAVAPATLTAGPIVVMTSGGTAMSATNFAVTTLPIISGFTPASGPNKRMVTLTGANFTGGAVTSRIVRINGISASSSAATANQITFPVPVGATTGPITVTTTGASGTIGTATSATIFVVAAGTAPANNAFASAQLISGSSGTIDVNNTDATVEPGEPRHGGNLGGASVWYRWVAPATGPYLFQVQDVGLNMGANQAVYVGNAVNALMLVASGAANSPFSRFATSVMFNATAGTTYRIAVDGHEGLMGETRLAWAPLGVPTISGFPGSAYPGQSITISGANFAPGASVTIGNVPVPGSALTYNSASSISVVVPSNAATGKVAVTTLAGTVVSGGTFTLLAAPAPIITGLSPTSGAPGASVTISGTALSLSEPGLPDVRFNNTPVTTITSQSSTSLSVRVPIGATSGVVTVQTSKGVASSAASFTVLTSSTPVLYGFSPAAAPVGAAVTLTGVNFSAVTTVTLNGASVPFAITGPGSIVVTSLPPGITSGSFRVLSPTGSATSAATFLVTTPPVVTTFSPSTISAGNAVVVTGVNFSAVTGVTFNGLPAASFVVDSNTQITAIAPGGLTSGPIGVTTQEGSAISSTFYAVSDGPFISSFTPTAIATGANVTITGGGFSGVSAVWFNGVTGNFTVNSPSQIVAIAPATLTAGPITVTTSSGNATSTSNFTVTTAPIVTSFSPSIATNKQEITVTGANFLTGSSGNVSVSVNGIGVTSSSRSNTQITFPIPVGATTGPITITSAQGATTSTSNITIAAGPAPANDAFANALLISGPSGVVTGNTANATKEPGEPNHSGNAGGASVWFRWTAPASGWFLFNPYDSSSQHYGIVQAIYTGDSVGALTQVASGLSGSTVFTRYTSAAALNAVAGTTYSIALDGFGGVMANYRLAWSPLNAPTLAGFSPASGAAGQTLSVVVTGSGFVPGSTVSLGGAPVASSQITYGSSTSLTIGQIPISAVAGPIVVTTPAGAATSAGNFTITSPYILGFTPSGAAVGTIVAIVGANLRDATAVRFNGTPALTFTAADSGQSVSTVVPPGATTGPISIVTPIGTAVSSALFTVIVPPVITQQPQSQTVFVGDSVSFTVAATSNGPLEYFWRKDGAGLIGNPTATSATLVIPSASLADAGVYDCQVGNNAAILTSSPATLTVEKVAGTVALGGLLAVYDGTPKSASATTTPSGLAVDLTYNGSSSAPVNAGSYGVVATINDAKYAGAASGTLVIERAPATIAFSGLAAIYNGTPKSVGAASTPAGLPIEVTYDGSPTPPTGAGTYVVAARVIDPNYNGTATAALTIEKANATVTLANLLQSYDGTPRSALVSTVPAGLVTNVTYAGNAAAPVYPGNYPVVATVVEANYRGSASGALTVATTAFVRRAPIVAGALDGSLRLTSAENVAVLGNAWIARDLLMPGTPTVQVRGSAQLVGTRDAGGAATPSGHGVSLDGTAVLRYLVQRLDAAELPIVTAPPAPTGSRDVVLTAPTDAVGDFGTLRNLMLRSEAGSVAIPPGSYGRFVAEGRGGFILGVPGSTESAVYNLQALALNGTGAIELVGPVVLTVAEGVTLNGAAGSAAHPDWLVLRISTGGATLNGPAIVHGNVLAPSSTVTIAGNATVQGRIVADTLELHNGALLKDPAP